LLSDQQIPQTQVTLRWAEALNDILGCGILSKHDEPGYLKKLIIILTNKE
jgi:hypothetical protein